MSISSTSQDSYLEMCESMRIQLQKQILLMPAMKIDEQKILVETVHSLMTAETRAKNYDDATNQVERRLNNVANDVTSW